jgi:ATP citrate (pro-S)-lyase
MNIDNLAVIAEGIPEHQSVKLNKLCIQKNIRFIGPSTVGGILSGQFRIGNTGGSIDNILECQLNVKKGSVGFVTRSGGLLNELSYIVSHNTNGVNQAISIGGDRYPGSNFIDYILDMERNPEIKMIILLGEVGGIQELLVSEAKKNNLITKPIIGWCMGTSAEFINNTYGSNIQFGHAGASANSDLESAIFKNRYMKESGIIVPETFEKLSDVIKNEYLKIDSDYKYINYNINNHNNIDNRRKPTFYSSISNENKDELEYNGIKISEFIKTKSGLGKTIGHLWLKKDLPDNIAKYLELILIITADHGGMVSGAHNTMVSSRAGKDLVSSLCSGLLTIGDRFGGALNKSIKQFNNGYYIEKLSPMEFVKKQKSKGELIYGIGHKVKSIDNPDIRVKLLKQYIFENFNEHKLVDYALEVEKITTSKKNNLILNVDGFIAVSLLDVLKTIMNESDIEDIIENELMNGFFVLGRSIGFIGHWFDQKRLNQGLFRLNSNDIEYL